MQDIRPVEFSFDPAFAIASAGWLAPTTTCSPLDAWRHLTAAVSRNPKDLEAHTRRVLLAAAQVPLSDRLFGALLDVFLALGPHGRHLREQLLDRVALHLDPEDQLFFRHCLTEGLRPDAQLPSTPGSVLDPAMIGTNRLVEKQRVAVAEVGVLEQAISLLDDGDLDGAKQLLEGALLASPTDAAVAKELLLIYKHSRDEAAQAAMVARLHEQGAAAPEGWV
jgi:hypothetical protein